MNGGGGLQCPQRPVLASVCTQWRNCATGLRQKPRGGIRGRVDEGSFQHSYQANSNQAIQFIPSSYYAYPIFMRCLVIGLQFQCLSSFTTLDSECNFIRDEESTLRRRYWAETIRRCIPVSSSGVNFGVVGIDVLVVVHMLGSDAYPSIAWPLKTMAASI